MNRFFLLGACVALAAPGAAAQLRLDPNPLVQIGNGDADEYMFTRVASIARMSNGNWVVVDQRENVRVFDGSGKFVRRLGRKGQGPGEFQSPFWAAVGHGDTLFVYDYSEGPGKLNTFTSSGVFIQSSIVLAMPEAFATQPLRLMPDGSVLMTGTVESTYPRGKQRPYRGESALIRYSFADSVRNVLRFPGQIIETELRPYLVDGRAAANDSLVFIGDGETGAIKVYGLDGRLRREGMLPVSRPRVTSANKDAWLQRMRAAQERSPDRKASIEQQIARTVFPNEAPAYSVWKTDASGNLWVGPPPTAVGAEAGVYLVFDASLRQVGRITLPPKFLVIAIGKDYVAGTVTDADDVPRVRVYRLTR